MSNFWRRAGLTYHFGNYEDTNKFIGFPFLIYLISKNKFDFAEYIITKYPDMIHVHSKLNWSPLHEAVYKQSVKLIHIIMTLGGDPFKIGTRDDIENNDETQFFNTTPEKMAQKSLSEDIKNIMSYEITHKNKYGNDYVDQEHACDKDCDRYIAHALKKEINTINY